MTHAYSPYEITTSSLSSSTKLYQELQQQQQEFVCLPFDIGVSSTGGVGREVALGTNTQTELKMDLQGARQMRRPLRASVHGS